MKLSKVQRTVLLHSWQLDPALGSGPRLNGKLVSENCSQTAHSMEGLQGWKHLKPLTPEERQIANRWRESWKRSLSEASANSWPRSCPAGLSGQTQVPAQMATEVTRRDTSRNTLHSQELTACQAHRGFPGSNKPNYPGQVNLHTSLWAYWFKKIKMYQGRREEDGESGGSI